MTSNHLILCCPLLLLPSSLPSIRVFSNESALCIMWPNYRGFGTSPSNEFPGGSEGKESTCNVVEPGLIPGSGRSREMATHSSILFFFFFLTNIVWFYLYEISSINKSIETEQISPTGTWGRLYWREIP